MSEPLLRTLEQAIELLRSGDPSAAAAHLAPLCADPDTCDADALQLLALARSRSGAVAEATRLFERYLARVQGNPGAWSNFGNHLRAVDAGRARACYERAVALDPRHSDALYGLAVLQAGQGEWRAALDAAERAYALKPAPRLDALLGHVRFQLGSPALAATHFARALELRPDDAELQRNHALALRTAGEAARALAFIDGLARGAGPALAQERAAALLELARPEEARETLVALLEQAPDLPDAHQLLDDIHYMLGDDARVGESLRRALVRNPDPALQGRLALHLERVRRNAEALEILDTLGQPVLADPELAWCRARLLAAEQRTDEAHGAFERALARFPTHRELGRDFARLLIRAGALERAGHLVGEGLARDPSDQELWAHQGTLWKLAGDPRYRWVCDYERLVGLVRLQEFGFDEAMLADLEALLRATHRFSRQPPQQTLLHGTQTFGALFNRTDAAIVALVEALRRAVGHFIAALPPVEPAHPLLRSRPAGVRFAGSWSVLLRAHGFHVSHTHPRGWISSACYVSLPPPGEGDAGCLVFGRSNLSLPDSLDPVERTVRPERGLLVLFPSYFWHATVPFAGPDEETRLTVAFDVARD